MLRYLTAGESHGKCLTAIIEGLPSGVELDEAFINGRLARRQQGYGRGGRMAIERDTVEITAGVRHGKTLGSPVCLVVKNRDYENWEKIMGAFASEQADEKTVTKPRPGHADLAGAIKYGHRDIRNILERASARETAIRTAVGAVAMCFINSFGITVRSYVHSIGNVTVDQPYPLNAEQWQYSQSSQLSCPDPKAEALMMAAIDKAKENGDSLGGIFRVVINKVPVGLGSHVHWDRRLDANLSRALMGIPAIKGVEFGMGFAAAGRPGSEVHDELGYNGSFFRSTNNAGGIEGGISNGEEIVISCAMKPIPTLYKPLRSVDLLTKEPFEASIERSDVCAVPAAAVVAEAASAFEIAAAIVEKFGGDSLEEMLRNYNGYMKQAF